MAVLVGDIGSTSADWAVVDRQVRFFKTKGYNPVAHAPDALHTFVSDVATKVKAHLSQGHGVYYGSGIVSAAHTKAIRKAFLEVFKLSSIEFHSDLVAAAHACLGHSPGLIGILGTGSNIGAYNGTEVHQKTGSLGYLCGDEGSGFDIGRRILKAFFYGDMNADLQQSFSNTYQLTREDFLRKIANEPRPNQFVASFTRFAIEHRDQTQVESMVSAALQDFFRYHVNKYSETDEVNFVGSVAYFFRETLANVALQNGFRVGTVLQKPIDKLAKYYQKRL